MRYENGYRAKDHKDEIEVANQIRNQFGGKIVLLKEANVQGIKTPDYAGRNDPRNPAADQGVRTGSGRARPSAGGSIETSLAGADNVIAAWHGRSFSNKTPALFYFQKRSGFA